MRSFKTPGDIPAVAYKLFDVPAPIFLKVYFENENIDKNNLKIKYIYKNEWISKNKSKFGWFSIEVGEIKKCEVVFQRWKGIILSHKLLSIFGNYSENVGNMRTSTY